MVTMVTTRLHHLLRPGAEHLIMVPKYNYLVYTQSRARIVKEQIGVPPPVTVLNNLVSYHGDCSMIGRFYVT